MMTMDDPLQLERVEIPGSVLVDSLSHPHDQLTQTLLMVGRHQLTGGPPLGFAPHAPEATAPGQEQ